MKPEDGASFEIVGNSFGCAGEDTGSLPEEVKTGKDLFSTAFGFAWSGFCHIYWVVYSLMESTNPQLREVTVSLDTKYFKKNRVLADLLKHYSR